MNDAPCAFRNTLSPHQHARSPPYHLTSLLPPNRSLLGLIAFTAPYLPWALLGFSLLLGHDVTSDFLGIGVGHIYYFLADVYPALARARGWRIQKVMHTPWLLHVLFGTHRRAPPVEIVEQPGGRA